VHEVSLHCEKHKQPTMIIESLVVLVGAQLESKLNVFKQCKANDDDEKLLFHFLLNKGSTNKKLDVSLLKKVWWT
jgi:hypothetical protein